MESGVELMPGVKDLGGVVIDLQGGNYTITKPIIFPSGAGNVLVKEGTLRASDLFPTDRYLVVLITSTSINKNHDSDTINLQQTREIYYEAITFRDILHAIAVGEFQLLIQRESGLTIVSSSISTLKEF
ncbi:unnamed protein product [Lupinus luteus]|uniref:Uncharacterized protein n=1 Tax=Lupinus luteus TaxID=3873 RepID=A0AAV1VWY8_LUPLU